MALEFKLPDIGEGLAEGEITRWLVVEGQSVKENDPFVEVMTDKATVEITAPATGKVASIKFKAGTTVPVGTVIAVIETAGGSAATISGGGGHGSGHAAAPAAPAAPVAAGAGASNGHGSAVAVAAGGAGPSGRVLAAPAVRRRARELGIDLRSVPGTGPAGRVSRLDFEKFTQQPSAMSAALPTASAKPAPAPASAPAPAPVRAPAPAASVGGATEERVPLKGIRKRIAERMQKSKRNAAHFTYVDEVDVTNLVDLRESLKASAQAQGVKLTYMPFIIQATAAALKIFPMLNSSLDEEKQEIVVKRFCHMGFACDTEQGLMVPVIKDADRRSILNLGAALQDLSSRAREGKLALDEVSGSTFTITNAGNIGGILATPVINYPEVAILGVHKIADRAVVRNGSIVIRKMMNLSVSIDHRIVDGATGARFMNEIISLLEDPRRLLLGSL
ncbi:MAG: 2-oxo acid dehydrogenase subunit E2 [Planctomycetes bacterium]|nr:2-oxo acid dehydrogenase subunit E2 [Planctomycetota bacterium]